MDIFEYGKYQEFPIDKAKDLRLFLSEVWDARFVSSNFYVEGEQTEEEFAEENIKKQRFLRFDGDKIAALNYVGFIQFEGEQINIWPKIFNKNHDHNLMTSHILYWLSYCQKVHFPKTEIALEKLNFDNLLEAFIYIFSHYAKSIIESQPYQCYEEITEDTIVMRGRLEMNGYITRHLTTGNWQNLHCTYEPFIYDNQFNRIVKYVSSMLSQLSRNESSKAALSEILFLLDEVTDQICTPHDCQKVKFNRLFEDLDIILEMCKMFLENTTITSTRDQKQNFCFLLPMEYIFEDFLFGFIERHFLHTEPKQHKSELYLTDENVFRLEHDILLSKPALIIDAKYKIRKITEKDKKKAGISQTDMYQQICYSLRRGVKDVLLIYPTITDQARESNFTVSNHSNIEKINIAAIDINIFSEDIKLLDNKLIEQIKRILSNYA